MSVIGYHGKEKSKISSISEILPQSGASCLAFQVPYDEMEMALQALVLMNLDYLSLFIILELAVQK